VRVRFVSAALAMFCLSVGAVAQPPSFESVATGTAGQEGSQSGITVPVPASSAGAAAGDLLVGVVGVKINENTVVPPGWTAVPGLFGVNTAVCASAPATDPASGIRCHLNVFWKISDGTETSVTVAFSPAPGSKRQAAGAVLRYSGTHPTDPIGPVAFDNGASTSPTAPAIVTTEADTLVLRLGLADADEAKSLLLTPPATERFNLASTSPFGPGSSFTTEAVTLAGSDAVQVAAGNTGAASWSLPLSAADPPTPEEWAAATVAIRPEPEIVDADLLISKTDGLAKVNPGSTLTYTIVASNAAASPSDVFGAAVDDLFPSSLECTWTCSASGSASCSAAGVGDIADLADLPVGDSVTYTAVCDVDAGAVGTISNTATVTAPVGVNDTDSGNNDALDTTAINVAPVAQCADVVVSADGQCQGTASIDDGSFDPDGDAVTIEESPAPPYELGDTLVTLTIEDALGLSDTCQATVTVVDDTDPVIECNAPATITPPDAPIAFTATATDNCSIAAVEVVGFACTQVKRNGKVIDKRESCVVVVDGDTITIADSGGVATTISWTVNASDGSGNDAVASCAVTVANPGQGH
jgi:uncharacterized repeat protein (TIGR01451 family)